MDDIDDDHEDQTYDERIELMCELFSNWPTSALPEIRKQFKFIPENLWLKFVSKRKIY